MTSEAQRALLKKIIERHTKKVTATKKAARDSLVKEGFYTEEGKLTEEYGGKKKAAQ